MSGETSLSKLLQSMQPVLCQGEYVFCSLSDRDRRYFHLQPIGQFQESEGITLIIKREQADAVALSYTSVFSMIIILLKNQAIKNMVKHNPPATLLGEVRGVQVSWAQFCTMLKYKDKAYCPNIRPNSGGGKKSTTRQSVRSKARDKNAGSSLVQFCRQANRHNSRN